MRKSVIILILALGFGICSQAIGQDKYFTRTGHVYFISRTDVIDIDGNNHQVGSILNIETGELVFSVLIKSFEFTLATAEEHFNETYMESDEFPKAKFKGNIDNMAEIDLGSPGTYQVTVTGMLTIHGETNQVTVPAEIQVKEAEIIGKCEFSVHLDDYRIKVPKVVEDRVAKEIDIKIDMNYKPYTK